MSFLLIALYGIFTSCTEIECDNCIYGGEDKTFHYYGVLINLHKRDTTYYSIVLRSGNSRFLAQNKLQYEVVKYESVQKLKSNFRSESTTGFKENEDRIWLHPPRVEKFKRITQLAPYPQINFPVEVGAIYEGHISMASNWGNWSGKRTSYTLAIDSLTETTKNDSIIYLSGSGTLESDTCEVWFLFSKTKGFYEWNYLWNDSIEFRMNLISTSSK